MSYNLRSNPTKRKPYSPLQPQQRTKQSHPANTIPQPTNMDPHGQQNEDNIHRLLSESNHTANSEIDIGVHNFNPSDELATDQVRRLLGIPDQRGNLPADPSTVAPKPTNIGDNRRIPPNPTQTNRSTNPQNPMGYQNLLYPPIPPLYPFLTPPPPIVNHNETNRLLNLLLEKMDNNFQNMQVRSENANSGTPPIPQRTDSSRRSQPPNEYVELLEQRITNLSNQVVNLTNQLNPTGPNVQNRPSTAYKVHPQKWNLCFSDKSKIPIDTFLFQITTLQEANNVDDATVVANFHLFLDGSPLTWYWRHRSTISGSNFTLHDLKEALIKKYRSSKTDEEIWLQMAARKQGEKERFNHFYEAIEEIHSLCREPRSERAIIKLLKSNVKLGIQKVILTYEPPNLTEFIQKCEECDELVFPHLYQPSFAFPRKVSEFTNVSENSFNEAMSYKNCLNCGNADHLVKECDQPIQLVCYKCHKKGFTVRTCPDCNQQNFRINEVKEESPPENH